MGPAGANRRIVIPRDIDRVLRDERQPLVRKLRAVHEPYDGVRGGVRARHVHHAVGRKGAVGAQDVDVDVVGGHRLELTGVVEGPCCDRVRGQRNRAPALVGRHAVDDSEAGPRVELGRLESRGIRRLDHLDQLMGHDIGIARVFEQPRKRGNDLANPHRTVLDLAPEGLGRLIRPGARGRP